VAENTKRQSSPYIPKHAWSELRRKFVQSVPGRVTPDYLQASLRISERTAQAIIAPLKAVGLIDGDGRPTELANDWRSEDHHAEACRCMLERAYPEDLREIFPGPEVDRGALIGWFMRNARLGEKMAEKNAIFYMLLARPELVDGSQATAVRVEKPGGRPRRSGGRPSKPAEPSGQAPMAGPPRDAPGTHGHRGDNRPDVHIDINIHISADAGPEQIDKVFESMARHLYGRGTE